MPDRSEADAGAPEREQEMSGVDSEARTSRTGAMKRPRNFSRPCPAKLARRKPT